MIHLVHYTFPSLLSFLPSYFLFPPSWFSLSPSLLPTFPSSFLISLPPFLPSSLLASFPSPFTSFLYPSSLPLSLSLFSSSLLLFSLFPFSPFFIISFLSSLHLSSFNKCLFSIYYFSSIQFAGIQSVYSHWCYLDIKHVRPYIHWFSCLSFLNNRWQPVPLPPHYLMDCCWIVVFTVIVFTPFLSTLIRGCSNDITISKMAFIQRSDLWGSLCP